MDPQQAFKFCLRCGRPTKLVDNHLACSACGLDFYLNPKPCNGLVLKNKNGEIMLVERRVEPKKGYWDVPGGFLEINENFEESMKREAKEELGIEIENLKYLGSFTETYLFQEVNYYTVGAMFSADIKGTDAIKPADDVAGYKFFKPSELPYDKFAFPWMKKFFDGYL